MVMPESDFLKADNRLIQAGDRMASPLPKACAWTRIYILPKVRVSKTDRTVFRIRAPRSEPSSIPSMRVQIPITISRRYSRPLAKRGVELPLRRSRSFLRPGERHVIPSLRNFLAFFSGGSQPGCRFHDRDSDREKHQENKFSLLVGCGCYSRHVEYVYLALLLSTF